MEEKEPRAWSLGIGRRERDDVRRANQVKLRLNDEELLWLSGRAANRGVSIQRYLMECAQASEEGVTLTDRKEMLGQIMALRRLLANIANNVNQVAAAANSGADVKAQAAAVFAAARRASDRIFDAIQEMTKR